MQDRRHEKTTEADVGCLVFLHGYAKMSVILFKLNNVPDDEAEEVRELLAKNNIDYYETSAGKWGISMPAIWLNDETQFENARRLIEAYQSERVHRIKEEYRVLKGEGKIETIIDRIKQKPIQSILYLAIILFVTYVSIKPFIDLGE